MLLLTYKSANGFTAQYLNILYIIIHQGFFFVLILFFCSKHIIHVSTTVFELEWIFDYLHFSVNIYVIYVLKNLPNLIFFKLNYYFSLLFAWHEALSLVRFGLLTSYVDLWTTRGHWQPISSMAQCFRNSSIHNDGRLNVLPVGLILNVFYKLKILGWRKTNGLVCEQT